MPVGSPCNAFTICGGGSSCVNGTCLCKVSEALINGRCGGSIVGPIAPVATISPNLQVISVLPGQPCNPLTSVCTGGSECRANTCSCPAGFVISENRCLDSRNTANPGQRCDFGTRCLSGSTCDLTRFECVCGIGFSLVANQCVSIGGRGGGKRDFLQISYQIFI